MKTKNYFLITLFGYIISLVILIMLSQFIYKYSNLLPSLIALFILNFLPSLIINLLYFLRNNKGFAYIVIINFVIFGSLFIFLVINERNEAYLLFLSSLIGNIISIVLLKSIFKFI